MTVVMMLKRTSQKELATDGNNSNAVAILCKFVAYFCVVVAFAARCDATTNNIKEIFIGKCWQYQRIEHSGEFSGENLRNCTDIWLAFASAWMYKDACGITHQDYESYFEKARYNFDGNKAMFWSGLLKVAGLYAEIVDEYVVMEETLFAYVVSGLSWCGQRDEPGIDYGVCGDWNRCAPGLHAEQAFWQTSSAIFARQASGEPIAVLNGSRAGNVAPYFNGSIFAQHEVPSLNASNVHTLRAIVIHQLNDPMVESCADGASLRELERQLTSRGIKYKCEDDPADFRHLSCVDNSKNRQCLLAAAATRPQPLNLNVTSTAAPLPRRQRQAFDISDEFLLAYGVYLFLTS